MYEAVGCDPEFTNPLVGVGLARCWAQERPGPWPRRQVHGQRPTGSPGGSDSAMAGTWSALTSWPRGVWNTRPLPTSKRERHGVVAAGDLRSGRGQNPDGPTLVQADIKLVVGPEVSHAGGDRVVRIDDANVERTAGIVGVLGIPDHASKLHQSRANRQTHPQAK